MTDHQAPDNGLPAPEWLWVWRPSGLQWDDIVSASHGFHPRDGREVVKYVPETALEAAQARIAAIKDTLNIERALSDGAHRRAKAARREAYTECAKIADDWFARSGHGSPGADIRATLEALEKGDANGVG